MYNTHQYFTYKPVQTNDRERSERHVGTPAQWSGNWAHLRPLGSRDTNYFLGRIWGIFVPKWGTHVDLRPSGVKVRFACCCLWMLCIVPLSTCTVWDLAGSWWLRTKLPWRNLRIIGGSFFSKNVSCERSTSVPCQWRVSIGFSLHLNAPAKSP